MKKILGILILLGIISCKPFVRESYYDDGVVKSRLLYKNGLLEGKSEFFYYN